ncbi:hypothetical protein MP638_007033 [Amoeboaphelidium occidentale]|nr:hypothetical protein MP638_007033 [Amoeboaphelidium occidentale]
MSVQVPLLVIAISISFLLVVSTMVYYLSKKQADSSKEILNSGTGFDTSTTVTDLQTIVNSVMGISKHAAFIINHSAIAKVRKLTSGGGGELFIAQVMNPSLMKKFGGTVIQKVIFIKSQAIEEAFHQEVGVMITLSKFPHFCQIIGYTEHPASIILKYYPDGSLYDWIRRNHFGRKNFVKIAKEISLGLNTMHSYYLAHCDLKPQNILVEVDNEVPSCFLTDFGITQVLSMNIVASNLFSVTNLRGLSVHYASPEAFTNFRTKKHVSVDFKKYDIFSFGCLLYELFIRRSPWS